MDYVREPIEQRFGSIIDAPKVFQYNDFETQEENIDRLIEFFGGNINYVDDAKMTILHMMILANNVDMVRYLLKKGANPNISGYAGYTPMFYGVLYGNSEIVLAILEYGGDPTITDNYGENSFQISKDEKITEYLRSFYPD